MNKHVRFVTLGCRVNQYETQAMRESLADIGIDDSLRNAPAGERNAVDFVVINTCTVTHAADSQNLYWIRRMKRENPQAKIVVTGCYVEKNRAEIERLPGVDLVISNQEKTDIAALISDGCGTPGIQDAGRPARNRIEYSSLKISESSERSRATIKIQDGCNHACSFCKVVMVRGRSRSRPLTEIVLEAERLAEAGYREIVFAGIQLGAYGLELERKQNLRDVITACSEIEGIERIRLSSIEPTDVDDELIEVMSNNPKCCPHLHIPLQSGDDKVLKLMNRRYDRNFYEDLIARLKSKIPDFQLTLDVMAGFPGEEDENFRNTVELLRNVKPLKCHVFPYSKREGTRAFGLSEIPEAVKHERVRHLMALSDEMMRGASIRYTGKTFPILVERGKTKGNLLQGLAPNFMRVCFQGEKSWIGKIIPVTFLTLQGQMFLGRPVREDSL